MNKITLKSQSLIDIIEPLNAVISDSHITPINQCVFLQFKSKSITAIGDNSEVRCVVTEKMKFNEEASVCVNYSMLMIILKSIKNQTIEFRIGKVMAAIVHEKGEFELPVEDSSVFPVEDKSNYGKHSVINGSTFKSSIKVANKFTLNDSLDTMSNVSIELGKKTTVRSTNRRSLFKEKLKGKGDKGDVLISGKSSQSLMTLMSDKDSVISFNETRVYVVTGNKLISIIQQDGKFPIKQFDAIIDSGKQGSKLKIDYKDFNTSLKRSSALSGREKESRVYISISNGKANVSCVSKMSSTKAEETILAEYSEDFKACYSPLTLIEIISVFTEKCEFFINDKNFFCIKESGKFGIIAPMLSE